MTASCGAACLTSLVVEEDDCNCVATAPQQTQRGAIYEQVAGNVAAPGAGAATTVPPSNLQLFVLTRGVVASLIELPALDNSSALLLSAPPGGGVTAGLRTATRKVRVLLRDLAGKTCWDASALYRKPEFGRLQSSSPPPPEGGSTTTTEAARAAATPFEQQQQQQRVVMRQRPPNVLPDAANAAPDYDQLHDLLQYVGYEQFLATLAWEVELETHTGFLGGLRLQQQRQDADAANGVTAPYVATCFTEVVFHMATRMPGDTPEAVLNKTRHLSNDEVHVVWSEHSRDYRRDIIATEFCDVLIVIYPLGNQLHPVTVDCKPGVPYFGVLYDEAIVDGTVLAALIRTTVICASRARRTTLPFYQQYYEERARSLDTIMTRHRDAVMYEDFVSRVYSPPPIATNNNNTTTLTSTPPSSGGHSTITTTIAPAAAPSIGNSLSDSNNSGAISCAATHTLASPPRIINHRIVNNDSGEKRCLVTTTTESCWWWGRHFRDVK